MFFPTLKLTPTRNQHVNVLCKHFTTRISALIELVTLSNVGSKMFNIYVYTLIFGLAKKTIHYNEYTLLKITDNLIGFSV